MLHDHHPVYPVVPQFVESLGINSSSSIINVSKENNSEILSKIFPEMTDTEITQFPPFSHSEMVSDDVLGFTTVASPISEVTDDESRYRLPLWGICVMIIAYSTVFIFGVVGNCSVVIVVTRLHRMKTVTNLFICNLALADLLVLLFCLVPNLISNIFVPWILGDFICKTVPYIQGLSVCASVYSLVAISVERCISIQWPFAYQITKRKAKIIMLGIWIWSFFIPIPWALFFETGTFDPDNPHLLFCIEVWPEEYQHWSKYYFLVGNFIICYALPLTIIFICYSIIWFRVDRRPVPTDSSHKSMEIMHQKAKRAVLKMQIVIIFIFCVTWTPILALTIRMRFGSPVLTDFEQEVIQILYPIAQLLVQFGSAANPIVYGFLNKKFKNGFSMIFKCSWTNQENNFQNGNHRPHKSPTVNILLRRMAVYKMRSSTLNDSDEV